MLRRRCARMSRTRCAGAARCSTTSFNGSRAAPAATCAGFTDYEDVVPTQHRVLPTLIEQHIGPLLRFERGRTAGVSEAEDAVPACVDVVRDAARRVEYSPGGTLPSHALKLRRSEEHTSEL